MGFKHNRLSRKKYAALRLGVFERDGWKCRRCAIGVEKAILEADHIVPRSRGGKDAAENLITLCRDCHRAKTEYRLRITGDAKNATFEATPHSHKMREFPALNWRAGVKSEAS